MKSLNVIIKSEVKIEKVVGDVKIVQCPDCPYPEPRCEEETKTKKINYELGITN
jgi:hypothetical protein